MCKIYYSIFYYKNKSVYLHIQSCIVKPISIIPGFEKNNGQSLQPIAELKLYGKRGLTFLYTSC